MKAGAIIHIIYEVLKTNNMLDKCFNSEYIFNNYTKIKNKDILIERFHKRKGNNIKTFEEKGKIYRWLYKHTTKPNNKYVYWFEKCNEKKGSFKLKKGSTSRLECERINNGI